MTEMQLLKKLFQEHNGILRSSVLRENGFYSHKISKLVQDGILTLIRRGYYQLAEPDNYSDIPILSALFPDGVLCMESALDYYDYTDRTPLAWQIAVDRSTARSRFRIDYPFVRPHFIDSAKFPIGITTAEIDGEKFRVYDRERTICDCLLHRNKMDAEVFQSAIRAYLSDPQHNVAVLADYAGKLRVENKVREVLGIWL